MTDDSKRDLTVPPIESLPDSDDSMLDDQPLSTISPADVGSASRSCLAIIIIGVAIALILCVSLAIRALI